MSVRPPPPALSDAPLASGLYVVATPIGNLRDITLRALDVLNACDLVLAEDTRVGGKLLAAYGLKKPLLRYDEHAAERASPRIMAALASGERLALISDAGTPLVSDPGFRLVSAVLAAGHAVYPIPGPSAALAALTVSGLPTDRFLFAGFLPPKSAARREALAELAAIPATLIFYETGPRLAASLTDMAQVLGAARPAAVARELTKLHETVLRAPLATLAADPRCFEPKGEIVVVVGRGEAAPVRAGDIDAALLAALAQFRPSEAAQQVARMFGRDKRELYRRALELKAK